MKRVTKPEGIESVAGLCSAGVQGSEGRRGDLEARVGGDELRGMEEAWDAVAGPWDGPRSDLESDLTRVERDGEETAQV